MANDQDNRVLARRGTRLVTEVESAVVNGGFQTDTICTIGSNPGNLDGDLFTGDCLHH